MNKSANKKITNTEEKLKEAKYFLQLLIENKLEGEKFDYILNAFIGSARSITWIMRAEFLKVPKWEEWYNSKSVSKKEEKLLKLFNELRVESTKCNPIKTTAFFSMNIPSTSLNDSKIKILKKLVGKIVEVNIAKKDKNLKKSKYGLYFDNVKICEIGRSLKSHSEEDAIKNCKKYFVLLEKLTRECLKEFENCIT